MDNTNNNTSVPNSPPPVSPTPSPWPSPTEPVPPPTSPPAPSFPWQTPVQPEPAPVPSPTPSPWPPDPSPVSTQPALSSWPTQPAITPEPAPAFGAPDQSVQYTDPNAFATANMQSYPSQQSSIPPVQSTPTWVPPQSVPQANPDSNNPMGIASSEQAPTDLSHLIGTSETSNQTSTQPETLVIPQSPTPDIPTVPTEHKGGIPKWVVGLGVGLLIVVAGASAYFIMGVGQAPKNISLPAQEVPTAVKPSQAPIETLAPQAATNSANFGELQGSGSAPQATSEATPNSFDRLRSR